MVLKKITSKETQPFSTTLAQTYEVKTFYRRNRNTVKLRSPYFWAAILDKGREAMVKSPGGNFFIYFQRPQIKNDPRIFGLWHRKKARIPKLSKNDFQKWARLNREHIDNGGSVYTQPMIVAREVGPTNPTNISKRGNREILRQTDRIIEEELDRWLREAMPETGVDRVSIDL